MFVPWETTRRGEEEEKYQSCLLSTSRCHTSSFTVRKNKRTTYKEHVSSYNPANILQPYCCWVILTRLSSYTLFFSQIWRDFSLICMFSSADCRSGCVSENRNLGEKAVMSLKGANSEGSVDGVKGQSAWQKGHLLSFFPEGHVWGQRFCFLQHTWGFRSLFISIK